MDDVRHMLDLMLRDLRETGANNGVTPCDVHNRPQWTCSFCLHILLERVEAALAGRPEPQAEIIERLKQEKAAAWEQALLRARERDKALAELLALRVGRPEPPQSNEDTFAQEMIDHWFIQGGEQEFGPLVVGDLTADGVVAAILHIVRAADGRAFVPLNDQEQK